MALVQVKSHGIVTDHKVRKMDDAYAVRNQMITEYRQDGYTLVGFSPNVTCLVCPQHANGQNDPDADFCLVLGVSSGRK